MAFIDNLRKLIPEDFDKDDQDVVEKIGVIVNNFMEQAIRQINGNIDITNLTMDIVTFSVTVDSTGTPVGNDLVKSNVSNPNGVVVIKAANQDNLTGYPTTAPFLSFTPTRNILKIKNISGLVPNNKYVLTLLVIP